MEERARQLEREHEADARRAVERERAHIARELHDIVAHRLSVIVAQAGATRRVVRADCVQARETLGVIESVGREALVEMRWLLGMLQPEEHVSEQAQPGLGQLPGLAQLIGGAGLPVELVTEGTPRPLSARVELSAFRIVQEALTNALKHAGPTSARVRVGYGEGFLDLEIRDDGHGNGFALAPGLGLAGMRERARLLGGEVVAGPRPEGGYQVSARIPVAGEGR